MSPRDFAVLFSGERWGRSWRDRPNLSPPAQLLNPCGSNHLTRTTLPQFWEVLSQGNKAAPYLYEGVDSDAVRQSVGVWRARRAIEAFCVNVVAKKHLETFVKPDVLQNIKKEAEELLPYLRTLCAAGEINCQQTELFVRSRDGRVPQPAEIATAATAVLQWIEKKPSLLKFVIIAFGADGLSRNAQVYEKCLHAHVSKQFLDKDSFASIMKKRSESLSSSRSATSGGEHTAVGYPLETWNTAPALLLCDGGSNHLSDAEVPQIWKVLSQGNKTVPYYYEGADPDVVRQSVGVWRACGAIEDFSVNVVFQKHLDTVVKPDVLHNIRKEAEELLPSLHTLNPDGLPTIEADRSPRFKRPRTDARAPTTPEFEKAAAGLFQWIEKKQSALKNIMKAFGSDGLSHNAQVYEKCLRAHVSQQGLDTDGFASMMQTRFPDTPAPAFGGAAFGAH